MYTSKSVPGLTRILMPPQSKETWLQPLQQWNSRKKEAQY
jgi:hypothetical protein